MMKDSDIMLHSMAYMIFVQYEHSKVCFIQIPVQLEHTILHACMPYTRMIAHKRILFSNSAQCILARQFD